MQSLALHPMLPRQSSEEQSRHAFLVDFKNMLSRDLSGRLQGVYETEALPEFRKRFNRDPETRQDVAKVMREQPFYQIWSALNRVQQELYVDSTADCVERQLPGLIDKYKDLKKNAKHGTLELSPELKIPRYISAVDIHCIPGGYFLELAEDDVYAGARYDIGSFIFGRGERGPLNDARGQTGVDFLKKNYPDLKPKRILDLGCASGMNTLPYVAAYPGAEVYGIDVSAPCLRYAHARAEALDIPCHFSQQSAEHTTFEDGSFDIVVSHILFHETSRKAVGTILRECHRLLKPGGVMLHLDVPRRLTATTPYDQFVADWDTMNNNEPFWGTFLFDIDIRKLALEAGFAESQLKETLANVPGGKMNYWALAATKAGA
ncbi:MAG: methyltransferase domain-containing protein [Rhodospirillaceae bacterium]|nr:methyltransferase domain-containing protein [Rhodospirillaceae bacterium]